MSPSVLGVCLFSVNRYVFRLTYSSYRLLFVHKQTQWRDNNNHCDGNGNETESTVIITFRLSSSVPSLAAWASWGAWWAAIPARTTRLARSCRNRWRRKSAYCTHARRPAKTRCTRTRSSATGRPSSPTGFTRGNSVTGPAWVWHYDNNNNNLLWTLCPKICEEDIVDDVKTIFFTVLDCGRARR